MSMASPEGESVLARRLRASLPQALPDFLPTQRWFGGKARSIASIEVVDILPISAAGFTTFLVLTCVKYKEGHDEIYILPLAEEAENGVRKEEIEPAVPRLRLEAAPGEAATFYDALWDKRFCKLLLGAIRAGSTFRGAQGEILGSPTKMFAGIPDHGLGELEPSVMKGEQSNTSIRFGDRFILKFYRRLEEGINPDLEIGAFLTDNARFKNTPPLGGALEYRRRPQGSPVTLAILQAFVPNQGDAWRFTLASLDHFYQQALRKDCMPPSGLPCQLVPDPSNRKIPSEVGQTIGPYWDSAALLGRRTAELHVALAGGSEDPNFRPEAYSRSVQQSQYQSMVELTHQVLRTVEQRMTALPASAHASAVNILHRERELLSRFQTFAAEPLSGQLIRIHGDYHLGQVLYTGSDFMIIDFEGEPVRSLEERRAKRCPLQDVAGMLRSFHYAGDAALALRGSKNAAGLEESGRLAAWATYWYEWVSQRFLASYFEVAANAGFLPRTGRELSILLEAHMLEKAVYELGYELNNRPDWVRLPLRGILNLLNAAK